jgi:hypothetical protein
MTDTGWIYTLSGITELAHSGKLNIYINQEPSKPLFSWDNLLQIYVLETALLLCIWIFIIINKALIKTI